MAVEAIRLQNFMAFEDTDWIHLGAITLLFGLNSRGKSAIIRALLLLKQSLDTPFEKGPLDWVPRIGADQGSFEETAHRKPRERSARKSNEQEGKLVDDIEIAFGFRCNLENAEVLERLTPLALAFARELELSNLPQKVERVDFTFGFRMRVRDNQPEIYPSSLRLQIPFYADQKRAFPAPYLLQVGRADESTGSAQWEAQTDLLNQELEPVELLLERDERGFFPRFVRESWDDSFEHERLFVEQVIDAAKREMRRFLNSIEYLGPLRPPPARIYALDAVTARDWRDYGWGAYVDLLADRIGEEEARRIGMWMRHLGVGQQVQSYPLHDAKNQDAVLARLEIFESGAERFNIKDVGFGASQVLPIVAQTVQAKAQDKKRGTLGSFVIIEQPELHLHPRAQALLADVFTSRLYQKIENKKFELTGVRFLLETHSENVFLGLQKLAAETMIGKTYKEGEDRRLDIRDLDAYFVDRKGTTSTVVRIEFNAYADILEFPPGFEGFFADDLRLSSERMEARLKARKQGK